MGLLHLAVISAVLLATSSPAQASRNPGISVRLSKSFLTYMYNTEIYPLIKKEILSVKIPAIQYHISGINTQLYLTEIKLDPKQFWMGPESGLQALSALDTGSFLLVQEIYLGGGGKGVTRARWWPYISSSGRFTFSTRPLQILLGMRICPSPDGTWQFEVSTLRLRTNFDIYFHSGFLHSVDIGPLRKYIDKNAGNAIRQGIESSVRNGIARLTPYMKKYLPFVTYPGCTKFGLPVNCRDFGMNFSLVSCGVFKENCSAEVQINGFVVYKGVSYLPASAKPFPPPVGCGDHYAAVFMSGSTFSSAIDAILDSKLVHANFFTGKYTDDPYYGKFVPGMQKKFGYRPLYANMTLLGSHMSLTPGRIATSISTRFQILVDQTPTRRVGKVFNEAFTMEVNVSVVLAAWLKPMPSPIGRLTVLYLNFTHTQVTAARVVRTNVGPVDDKSIHTLMQTLLAQGFKNADSLVTKGILIVPRRVKNVGLQNPQLLIGQNYLKLAIDLGKPGNSMSFSESERFSFDDNKNDNSVLKSIDLDAVPTTWTGALEAIADAFIDSQLRIADAVKHAMLDLSLDILV